MAKKLARREFMGAAAAGALLGRSEERRVGKECH